jgi:superfamily II DNA or RNA helicase
VIALAVGKQLLDFGARIGQGHRAEEQLEGAVAIHNILQEHRVAYLADEVGMGKTYVALGALALFRHFNPGFRVLILAPRENIQRKWMKEATNFAKNNVRFADLRVKALGGHPARRLVACENLSELVRESLVDPDRDFFVRMSSFSLPLGSDMAGWRRARDDLRESLPWLRDEVFDLRSNKDVFKDNVARAICCALPKFDLVIVDEAHNLKHGFSQGVAARNRVLALAMGHPSAEASERMFPGYGRRAERVLFLSATPLEETYRHVWNQLDVFGRGDKFQELHRSDLTEEAQKRVAAKFLVRRVTSIRTGGKDLTKNQYRREWRRGGVSAHDEPIVISDDRQRLIVALVQKKVSELLGSERFNASFQVGMLASFESFLETARVKRVDDVDPTFDDPDQTDDFAEREGLDVRDVNRLSQNYRKAFEREMPHPKMDAVVESLVGAWKTGAKTLVFVRRVASVKELKRRLDECYDRWLIDLLRRELPPAVVPRLEGMVEVYRDEKRAIEEARRSRADAVAGEGAHDEGDLDDRGGTDTFFAWFFRGEGPPGVVSGANVQRRFLQRGSVFWTFFEANHVAELLGVPPEDVLDALAKALDLGFVGLRAAVRRGAAKFLRRSGKQASGDRFEAAQAAAVELLKDLPNELGAKAGIVWRDRYANTTRTPHATEAPDVADWLLQPTFFSELLRPERAELRAAIWPAPRPGGEREAFLERELRARLLATAARLGHALIDLYILTITRLGSLALRAQEADGGDDAGLDRRRIDEYLDRLEHQRQTPLSARRWAAFDELHEIAQHFDLILDVNAPEAREKSLAETATAFGALLRQQQPIAGMSGQVNRTVVQQFRMPGYPFVLITTDLLQEGEDLHTFCSSVHHYGISWTPSAMEQRIGRIDRVRSQTDRRLTGRPHSPADEELLQVYYPHLEDTVEILQVQRVLERMNTFLRLMHEGLTPPAGDGRRIDVGRELLGGRRRVEAIRDDLRSAFPVPEGATEGPVRTLAVDESVSDSARSRFRALAGLQVDGASVTWEPLKDDTVLLGSATLSTGRVQPFALTLRSDGEHLVVRCVSPVGRVDPDGVMAELAESATPLRGRLGAIVTHDERSYDLSVEDDVLLGVEGHDRVRVALLITRVVEDADAIEQIHLPGRDQPLEEFEKDLEREVSDGT